LGRHCRDRTCALELRWPQGYGRAGSPRFVPLYLAATGRSELPGGHVVGTRRPSGSGGTAEHGDTTEFYGGKKGAGGPSTPLQARPGGRQALLPTRGGFCDLAVTLIWGAGGMVQWPRPLRMTGRTPTRHVSAFSPDAIPPCGKKPLRCTRTHSARNPTLPVFRSVHTVLLPGVCRLCSDGASRLAALRGAGAAPLGPRSYRTRRMWLEQFSSPTGNRFSERRTRLPGLRASGDPSGARLLDQIVFGGGRRFWMTEGL